MSRRNKPNPKGEAPKGKDAECDRDAKGTSTGKSQDKKREQASKGKLGELADYNDPTFYIKDPELLAQATNISFQNLLGIEPIEQYPVPTIMTIHMNPSIGQTYQGTNPGFLSHPSRAGINMASIKLFNKLSMSSGRNMAYAPQDIGTMLGAMSQVLAMISYGRRALGAVKLSSYRNRMFPKAIVEAMGFDYDDLVEHWSDYLAAFNNEIAALNQIPIIMNSGYMKKSVNQYDFIFTDAESSMSQCYIYVPYSTWIIDETADPNGTVLKTVPVTGNGTNRVHTIRTFATFMQSIFRPMVDALLTSSTMNLVYADLLHLAEKDSSVEIYTVPIVPSDYVVMPIHNYEALVHIHNSLAVGIPTFPVRKTLSNGWEITPDNDVYPDASNNALVYNPAWRQDLGVSKAGELTQMVLDSPLPEPSLDTKLEITRYKSVLTGNWFTNTGENTYKYSTYGITTDYYVVFYGIIQNDIIVNSSGHITSEEFFYNVAPATDYSAGLAAKLSQFDWGPMLMHMTSGSGAVGYISGITGDLNYYTVVDKYYLERLAQIVYFGLFDF